MVSAVSRANPPELHCPARCRARLQGHTGPSAKVLTSTRSSRKLRIDCRGVRGPGEPGLQADRAGRGQRVCQRRAPCSLASGQRNDRAVVSPLVLESSMTSSTSPCGEEYQREIPRPAEWGIVVLLRSDAHYKYILRGGDPDVLEGARPAALSCHLCRARTGD